jgi:hypothetical protein
MEPLTLAGIHKLMLVAGEESNDSSQQCRLVSMLNQQSVEKPSSSVQDAVVGAMEGRMRGHYRYTCTPAAAG